MILVEVIIPIDVLLLPTPAEDTEMTTNQEDRGEVEVHLDQKGSTTAEIAETTGMMIGVIEVSLGSDYSVNLL
jgi:hypothetical protein